MDLGNETHRVGAETVKQPGVSWELSAQLLGGMIVVLLLGLLAAPADDPLASFREDRLADHASAILLAMAGALAFAAFLLQAPARARRLFWLACACAFVFLAFDELMQLHERLGWWLQGANLARPESLPQWNGMLVTGYCVLALLFCAFAMPEIRRHKSIAAHLALGLAFFVAASTLDRFVASPAILEFGRALFQVLANTCFAIAMLAGLLSVVHAHRDEPATPGKAVKSTPEPLEIIAPSDVTVQAN